MFCLRLRLHFVCVCVCVCVVHGHFLLVYFISPFFKCFILPCKPPPHNYYLVLIFLHLFYLLFFSAAVCVYNHACRECRHFLCLFSPVQSPLYFCTSFLCNTSYIHKLLLLQIKLYIYKSQKVFQMKTSTYV